MAKRWFTGTGVVLLAGLWIGTADAQGPGPRVGVGSPPAGPTVSPYINLLRNGNSPAFNYYGLVRPQFQTNAGLQALSQQSLLAQQAGLPGAGGPNDVLVTGRGATFMNFGGYFQSSMGAFQPAGLAGVGGVRPGTPAPGPSRLPRPGPR